MSQISIKTISMPGTGDEITITASNNVLPEGVISANSGSIHIFSGSNVRIFTKTSGSGNTGWRSLLNNRYGTSASRPALVSTDAGSVYYDTTISRPIWWTGFEWLDPVAPATTSVKGLVNQAVAVPNGSSIDTLLAALRAAGIIAT